MRLNWLVALVILVGLGGTAASAARAATQLLHDPLTLRTGVSLDPDSGVIARQNVKLVIETATSGWFTGGTRIRLPEVPGLIILQNEKFAANASERRGGATWVVQRWTLDVFPMRPGAFSIPPITLSVSLKTAGGEQLSGDVKTPAIKFYAELPAALDGVRDWVAAPKFSVSQVFDRNLDDLRVGDAIEQTIEFEAADVMAMMLPAFRPARIEGLAAYPAPPVLQNRINRGQNSATRSVSVSYIVEAPGRFVLPAQDFYWWDTRNAKLEVITIPSSTLEAGGSGVADSADKRQLPSPLTLGAAGLFLCMAVAAAWHYRRSRQGKNTANIRLKSAFARLRRLLQPMLPEKLNP